MIIYSNLIKLFKHCGNYILLKLIMNIHEYSEYLDYFFDTLVARGFLVETGLWVNWEKLEVLVLSRFFGCRFMLAACL